MPRTNRPRRFDVVEVLLISALVAGSVWGYAQYRSQLLIYRLVAVSTAEAEALEAKYGPSRNSLQAEEWIIRDFFQDRRGGFFLDVGANHYQQASNTYFLETSLDWEGIAVEPLAEFADDYARFRPRTRFRSFFVSDASDEQAQLWVIPDRSLVASGRAEFTGRYGDDAESIEVPTITLNDLLDHEGVSRIDFLTMDIELWEPKALAGFDIERFRPSLVCVEAHAEVRQQLLDYFAGHGYVLVGRYLRADQENLYFQPLETAALTTP